LTWPGKIKGHEVAASEDNPEYLVRSEKSGKIAAHKPSALRRVK
jgi:Hypervirulence associated proteins TUDOR domain